MEQHSQIELSPESKLIIEGQLREAFGRLVYSHKTHEKCADILLTRLSRIKLWQIILSAITAAGFISVVVTNEKIAAVIGTVIAVILLALNAYSKDYDLGEIAGKHKEAANELWLIREKYLSLLTDLALGNKSIDSIQTRRDELAIELHDIYSGSPSTTFSAYLRARTALKQSEEMTFSDGEIDKFLPKELKRNK